MKTNISFGKCIRTCYMRLLHVKDIVVQRLASKTLTLLKGGSVEATGSDPIRSNGIIFLETVQC